MIVYVSWPLAAPPLGAVEGAADAADGAADAADGAALAADGALDAAGVDEHAPNTMAAMARNAMPRTRILVPPHSPTGRPLSPTRTTTRGCPGAYATEIPDFK